MTRGGLLRYDAAAGEWKRAGSIASGARDEKKILSADGHKSSGKSAREEKAIQEVVTDMAFSSKAWYAATGEGLLVSSDRGSTWTRKLVGPLDRLPVQSVRASEDGQRIRVVSLRGLVFSEDGGKSWTWHDLPLASGGAVTLDADPEDENTLIAGARNGLYISRDAGKSWQQAASGLPATPVQGFAATGGVFVAAMRTGGLYVSFDAGRTWDRVPGMLADGFFAAVRASSEPGVIYAASTTEGLFKLEWTGSSASSLSISSRPGTGIPSKKVAADK
jgi:photosystem II stability/assembly factor-like uncharacterized protein